MYRPFDLPVADWAAAADALHAGGSVLFAQTGLVGAAAAARFDGVYTYDIVTYSGDKFAQALPPGASRAPPVRPLGGAGLRRPAGATATRKLKPRRRGRTYDSMWRAAIAAGADRVTITSFNEWHEGTQIEPAAMAGRHGAYRYLGYDGAYGMRGAAAANAYLDRTRYWSAVFRSTLAAAAEDQGVVDAVRGDAAQLRRARGRRPRRASSAGRASRRRSIRRSRAAPRWR